MPLLTSNLEARWCVGHRAGTPIVQSRIVLTPLTMLIRPSLDGVSSVRELFGQYGRPSDHTGPSDAAGLVGPGEREPELVGSVSRPPGGFITRRPGPVR